MASNANHRVIRNEDFGLELEGLRLDMNFRFWDEIVFSLTCLCLDTTSA